MRAPMSVAEAFALTGVMDELVTVAGHLIVTEFFGYLAAEESGDRGVLVNEPRLSDRLMACMPVTVGSLVLFSGRASVEGVLRRPTGLPMFPAVLLSIRVVEFQHEDREPVRFEFD